MRLIVATSTATKPLDKGTDRPAWSNLPDGTDVANINAELAVSTGSTSSTRLMVPNTPLDVPSSLKNLGPTWAVMKRVLFSSFQLPVDAFL